MTGDLRSIRPSIVGPASGPPPPFPLYLSGPVVRGFGRGSKELGIPTANLDRANDSLKKFLELAREAQQQAGETSGAEQKVEDNSGSAKGTGIYFGFARILPGDRTAEPRSGQGSIVPSQEDISALPRQTAAYPSGPEQGAHDDVSGQGLNDDAKVWPMVMSVGWNPFYGNKELTAEVHIVHEYKTDFYDRDMRVSILGYIRPELNYISKDALIEDINTDVKVALASLAREAYAKMAEDPFFRS